MKCKLLIVLIVTVSSFLISKPLLAHHGSAVYDMATVTMVKATITDLVWSSPHIEIKFDAKDDKGNTQHWSLECIPPSAAIERGWTRKALKPGDMVTISFNPSKNGATVGYFRKAVFADGHEIVGRN
jgi:hypothetical protein